MSTARPTPRPSCLRCTPSGSATTTPPLSVDWSSVALRLASSACAGLYLTPVLSASLVQAVARHVLDRARRERLDQRAQIARIRLERAVEIRLAVLRRQRAGERDAAAARQLGRGVLDGEDALGELHRDVGLVDRLALVDDLLDRQAEIGGHVRRQAERRGRLRARRGGLRRRCLRALLLRLAGRHQLVEIDAADRDIGLDRRRRLVVGGDARLGGQVAEVGGEVVGPARWSCRPGCRHRPRRPAP